jgi:hypothetical protein
VGTGNGVFNDSDCTETGGLAGFSLLRRSGLAVLISGGTYTFKWKLAGFTAIIVCKKTEVNSPLIIGGEPGKLEVASLSYTGCSSESPTKCTVNSLGAPAGTINDQALIAELVENTSKTEILDLFLPKTGTKITTLLYLNKGTEVCALKGDEFPVEGRFLALIDSQETEAEEQALLFEPSSKEYVNNKGETKTAKLELGKEPATCEAALAVLADIEGKPEPFGVY